MVMSNNKKNELDKIKEVTILSMSFIKEDGEKVLDMYVDKGDIEKYKLGVGHYEDYIELTSLLNETLSTINKEIIEIETKTNMTVYDKIEDITGTKVNEMLLPGIIKYITRDKRKIDHF